VLVVGSSLMSEHISAFEFRRRLGAILDRVHLRHERFVVEREGHAIAAVVPVETLEAMDRLSRDFLRDVLDRQRGRGITEAVAATVADEAKRGSRVRRRR
jgi:PHD/YefM family antitoxin component YafN of YafNO toxin-antitoxin module